VSGRALRAFVALAATALAALAPSDGVRER
jgi:hypothetical protein